MKRIFVQLLLCLGICTLATTLSAQLSVTKTSSFKQDVDGNGKLNPGDILRYTITISNTSGANLLNIQFTDSNFPNQTLVAGSIETTPLARPDNYTGVIGNTLFSVPAALGVLSNDSDADGDPISVVSFSPTSAQGGSVIVTNNGGFTFLPAVGFQGIDTFTYTISDGRGGTNSATVTLAISNMVWYVNNSLAVNGDGRQTSPFNSITPLNGAGGVGDPDGTNDYIYLFTGSSNYVAGLELEPNQKLIGAGVALTIDGTTIYPATTRPLIGAGGAGVVCSTSNTIRGLNISATAGKGISGTNFGTITIDTAGVSSTGGAAIDFDTGTLAVTLDSLTCVSSPAEGFRLNNTSGTVGVSSNSSIAGTTGTALRLSSSSADVTFPGTISKSSAGQLLTIQSMTGGTVTLSGNLNASSSSSGILVQNCTGGTLSMTGTNKTLNTGANPAVKLSSNSGCTINFLNGGLSIITAGTGFTAAGGASAINVTGTNNIINSGNGTALSIVNSTIGLSGITFQTINSSGGSSTGIILDTTGVLGGLKITGTGTAGSGGTLANKTGTDGSTSSGIGIYMNFTSSNSFNWLQINDCQNFGIRGVNVTSTTMTNIVVNGVNGNSTPNHEGSVIFDNAFGSCALVNSTIQGSIEDNCRVENDTGTNSFLLSGCTIGNNSTVSGNIGARIASKNFASMTASIRNCTFRGNRTDAINCDSGGNSVLTVTVLTNTVIAGSAGNNQGNMGIEVTASLNSQLNFNIDGNKIGTDGVTPQPLLNTGIDVVNGTLAGGTPAIMTGTVKGNTVANAGPGQSGLGIRLFNQGYGTMAANVSGNNVSNVGLDYGLLVEASSNTGAAANSSTTTVGVTGNTVNVLSGALDAIRLQARGRGIINARINSNVSAGGGVGFRGLEIRQASQTIFGNTETGVFNLEGLTTGLQSVYSTIVNYLQSQNPAISLANCDALYVTGITGVASVSGIP